MRALEGINSRIIGTSVCLLSLIGGLSPIQSAYAQEGEAERSGTETIEDIIVTAERREGNLQTTPISITALTSSSLVKSGITSLNDLQAQVPGLQISTLAGYTYPYIRGVGSDTIGIAGDSSVTVHFDGVYLSRPEAANLPFSDIERIEVLRGPQGTLYGRNSVGGTINVIQKRPSDQFEASADAEYGRFNRLLLRSSVSGPLDALGDSAVRLSLLHSSNDGYVRNNSYDRDNGAPKRYFDDGTTAGRVQFQTKPSESVTLRVAADAIRIRSNGGTVKAITEGDIGFATAFPEVFGPVRYSPGFHEGDTTSRLFNHADIYGIHGYADIGVTDGIAFNSITGWRKNRSDVCYDSDGVDVRQLETCFYLDSKQFSHEMQLVGQGERLNWIIGTYYFREQGDNDFTLTYPLGLPQPFGRPEDVTVIIAGESQFAFFARLKTTALGAFAQATWKVTDTLHLTGGVRYSTEKKSFDNALVLDGTVAGGAPLTAATFQGSKRWSKATPKFGIEYFPRDGLMLYASVTNGFKSGGFNTVGAGDQDAFDPETVWSYEAGLKSKLLGGRATLNLSGFYYDYSGLQVNFFASGAQVITNAASAEVYGGELELMVRPIPSLSLSGSLSYLDATYRKYLAPGEFVLDDVVDLSGNRLPRSPKVTFNLAAEKSFDLGGDLEFRARGEYAYVSKQYYTAYNSRVAQDGYSLFNLRFSLQPKTESWNLSIFGRNLANEKYYLNMTQYSSTGFGVLGQVAAPRTWGISFGYRFK